MKYKHSYGTSHTFHFSIIVVHFLQQHALKNNKLIFLQCYLNCNTVKRQQIILTWRIPRTKRHVSATVLWKWHAL